MSTLLTIDELDFENAVIGAPVPVLVDFYADWCGPCKALAPTLEALQEEFGETVRILKVDADVSTGLTDRFGVRGLPTMILFRDGAEIDRPRVRTRLELRALLSEAAGLPDDAPATSATEPAAPAAPATGQLARVLDALAALDENGWSRVTEVVTAALTPSNDEAAQVTDAAAPDADDAAGIDDAGAWSAAATTIIDEIAELAVTRMPLEQAKTTGSSVAASFMWWYAGRPVPDTGWTGAFQTIPALRTSPYLPDGPVPGTVEEAVATLLATFTSLSDEDWSVLAAGSIDRFSFADFSKFGTAAFLGGVILVQATASLDIVPTVLYDAAWAPFEGVLDRAAIEAA